MIFRKNESDINARLISHLKNLVIFSSSVSFYWNVDWICPAPSALTSPIVLLVDYLQHLDSPPEPDPDWLTGKLLSGPWSQQLPVNRRDNYLMNPL